MNINLAGSLTDNQKAAVLTTLSWIGYWASMDISDSDDMLPAFENRLKLNFKLLNFNQEHYLLNQYDNEGTEELLYSTLKSLPTPFKNWFVVETYLMISAAGKITQTSMHMALLYCENFGISNEVYLELVEKAYEVTGDHEKVFLAGES